MIKIFTGYPVYSVLLLVLFSAAGCMSGPVWESKREIAKNRKRKVIYNTDGCDALYYPKSLPVTVENFIGRRLQYTDKSKVDSVFYCPLSSSFGNFTVKLDSADFMDRTLSYNPRTHNIVNDLQVLGTDVLKITRDYCRQKGLEFFISIRVNDTHDADGSLEKPHFLMSKFKREHPEYLMGSSERGKRPPYCAWSAVDFSHQAVRDRMLGFVREFAEKYDPDGIEYDFMRHMQLFKSVADGNHASESELKLMTDFMLQLRAVTEEVGRKRGRPILTAVRVPDSVAYCRAVGIDIEKWLAKGAVDLLITAGYFHLSPWTDSAELAEKYNVKFYGSLDESRIRARELPLPGRNSVQSYNARAMSVLSSGGDGVYIFNLEGRRLQSIPDGDIDSLKFKNKVYYILVRGTGGYRPWHYLKDGADFYTLPVIGPGNPKKIPRGNPYKFSYFIGDDFSDEEIKQCNPQVKVFFSLVGASDKTDIRIKLNNSLLPEINCIKNDVKLKKRIYSAAVKLDTLIKGENDFEFQISDPHKNTVLLLDIAVAVEFAK